MAPIPTPGHFDVPSLHQKPPSSTQVPGSDHSKCPSSRSHSCCLCPIPRAPFMAYKPLVHRDRCSGRTPRLCHHCVLLCPLIILLTVTFLILQGRGSIDLQSHQLHPRKALVTLLWVTFAKVGEFTSFLRRVHDPLQPLSTSSWRRQVMF